jgi:predicted dehydrogenase/type 1 glutamine amidotransferase
MHGPAETATRVLIVSPRLSDERRQALVTLVGKGEAAFADAHGPLTGLDAFNAVLIDGPLDPQAAESLRSVTDAVRHGCALVSIGATDGYGPWAELLGTTAGPPTPRGEYFAKIADIASPLTDRLTTEFPVMDRLTPLLPADGASVVACVNVGFRDLPAVTHRRLGQGHVVVSGLGNSVEALTNPDLALLLRRALTDACCRPRSEPRTIGMGIVGYGPFGGMGYYHGLAARSVDGLHFVAACDPNIERQKAAEEEFPGIRAYASAEELATDDDVDLVVIATPPVLHADLALQMLRAGKHVACEKPLTLTVADADRLLAAAEDHHRVLTVNQNRRWDPDFGAVRRAVEGGLLGELFNAETFVGGFDHPCRAWHSEVTMSGGAVYDWGAHHVDWIIQLMGSAPASVQTHGHKRVWHDVTNLDQLRLRMLWADGREAEFVQSDIAAVRRPKFYLQGTAGTLVGHYRPVTFERLEVGRGYVAETAHHAEAPAELTLSRYESGYGITDTRLPPVAEQRFAFHRNLADHLLLGEPLAVTARSARQVIAVLEASQRSSDDGGRTITLPDEP